MTINFLLDDFLQLKITQGFTKFYTCFTIEVIENSSCFFLMQLKVSRCHRDHEDKFLSSSNQKLVSLKHLISIQVHVLKIHVCRPIRFCTKVMLTEYMVLFACISQIWSVFMYVHYWEHMQVHERNHFVRIVKILVFLLLPFNNIS